ncbi:hypothetical protein [Ilumatobacter sp.]|uniref:hypothetical protein n=1 Tax=Ilumatobacter sp. TaxID=1967498 RepID=UPI003B52BB95
MSTDDPLLSPDPDAPRRAHHRPIRLPGEPAEEPNYALRRIVAGAVAIAVLAGAAVLITGVASSDETATIAGAEPGAGDGGGAIPGGSAAEPSSGTVGVDGTVEGDGGDPSGSASVTDVATGSDPVRGSGGSLDGTAVGSATGGSVAVGSTPDASSPDASAPGASAPGASSPDASSPEGSVEETTEPTGLIGPALPVVLPDHHGFQDDTLYVALYGTPGSSTLGVLGETEVDGSIDRAREVAAGYESYAETVVPSFEIIASVASFEAGEDGDYSNESSVGRLQPWVDAADEAGVAVVLDLQAGRARFDLQVQEFEELLLEPHVGVALDPEWRVGPNEIPEGGKIGSVTAAEVNATIDYLDALVADNGLPRKVLIVHQFEDGMIIDKTSIEGTENVQVVIHMDGFGPLFLKNGSYERVVRNLPAGSLPGWKNFYDEDEPTPTPAETMEREPAPVFVSFQ